MNRLYGSSGQFVDSPTWEAILRQHPLRSVDYFTAHPEAKQDFHGKWLGRLGYAHAMSAPLASPVVAGFPGALIALGSMGQPPFSDADLQAFGQAVRSIDDETLARASEQTGQRVVNNRLFIMNEEGQFLGVSPRDALDVTLADNLEAYAKRRIASEKPTSAGDRVLLINSRGEALAFTVSLHNAYAALGKGRILVLAGVPHYTEWLALTPEDFAADQEIGRLLPAFKFMFERYPEGVTLPTIASHVHLSPFHFHRRFTELLGITPKHFLFDCQIARAQELLISGTHELEEIAKLCGFAHQSHFTSRFKQATGLTPTRWRKLRLTSNRDATSLERARAI